MEDLKELKEILIDLTKEGIKEETKTEEIKKDDDINSLEHYLEELTKEI